MRRFLLALLACAAAFAAMGEVPVPKLTGHVVDLTATLDGAQHNALEAKLAGFEVERGAQVVVLLVPTLDGEADADFAGRVTDAWKLGRKGVDDGVLFLVAKQDRKLRIQTGRGVQGTLTDALSKRIVSDIVAPYFRKGDFAGGLDAGTDAIMKAVEGETLPLPAQRAQPPRQHGFGDSIPELFVIAFFVVPIVGMILRGIFGRFFGATITSGLTGVVVWLFIGSIALVAIAALLAFVFTLFSGAGIGRAVRGPGWGGGYVPGGWGGGGGGGFSGGGGGGGFSGGGGGFDGGGASGILVMHLGRFFRHAIMHPGRAIAAFPSRVLDAIQAEIQAQERSHRGEICFVVEAELSSWQLWNDVRPRQRAREVFALRGVWNTEENNGVLIYVLLAEHAVEIVADRGIANRVDEPQWRSICAAMEKAFAEGRFQDGAVEGVRGVAGLLEREYPGEGPHANELPDRPALI